MLIAAYITSFLGMIILPVVLWIIFTRRFALSWKLVLAGGLTFVGSQVLHIPLVLGMNSFLQRSTLLVSAIILGLLAGIFEETARFILFKFILKKSRSWKEGVLIGLGHGGTEALLIGISAVLTLVNMIAYRYVDLSTVPSIPPEQLELAQQQVNTFWSAQPYMAFLGLFERFFAMCFHVSASVMVLYGVASGKPIWYWLAMGWHTLLNAVAVFVAQSVGVLQSEGLVAVFAAISLWIVLRMRPWFSEFDPVDGQDSAAV